MADRYRFPNIAAFVSVHGGWLAAVEGDPEGPATVEAGIRGLAEHGVTMLQPIFRGAAQGDALEVLGREGEALAAYELGLEAADRAGEHMHTAELLRRRGVVRGRLGLDGRPDLEQALATAEDQGADHVAALTRADLAQVS